jgi:putative spermidine/putrescine transport system ATP-binding protein
MAFLELIGIRKSFPGGAAAVDGVDLAVERGEFISFLGPSGCGKTTTLRMVAGFERPTAGSIHIDGADVTSVPPNRRNIGMVFQSYALFPNMTVAGNIAYGLKIRRTSGSVIKRRVAELLELIHLEGRGDRYPWQLSGGQQQRVALARALAIEPQMLLLDEPLSALDAKIRVSLRQEIRAIQRQLGITTIYVTHDQEEALSLSDRIVVMNEGRVEQVGSPPQIYGRPASGFVARFVGQLNVLEARVVDAAAGRLALGDQEIRTSGPVPPTGLDGTMSVALRPESLRLGDGAAGANVLDGAVDDVTFLGSTVRVRVRLPDGTKLAVDTFNDASGTLPVLEAAVRVSFPSSAVLVLDDGPGTSTSPVAASVGG